MVRKKVQFMCTAFRDGLQSVFGARVLTRDILPAVEAAREAGITWFEAGGGARFQAPYFYAREDAFAAMDEFRRVAGPEANLQSLARGVSVVGLESMSSDFIRLHAQLFKRHGMTTVRNFDALNDVDNLIFSGRCIAEAGLKHQVCITLMGLPPGCGGAHDPEFYEGCLRRLLEADVPFDSLCFKDSTGTLPARWVHETVRRARRLLGREVPLHYHTHSTAGCAIVCYHAAIEAGIDAIDLSLAPLSGGSSQPDVLVMWQSLRGSNYELDVDIDKVRVAEQVLKDCLREYEFPPEAAAVEPNIPWSPMPGGALTANTQMLRDIGLLDRYPACLDAMGEVVRKGGFGTSATPLCQFYFQQAFNNVLFGPWRKIAPNYGQLVLGYYGRTPLPPDPEVVRLAAAQLGLPPARGGVLARNDADPAKGLAAARGRLEAAELPVTDENLFIVGACGDKGLQFLKGEGPLRLPRRTPAATAAPPAPAADIPGAVRAPLPGQVVRCCVAAGQRVRQGERLLVVEAMKMEVDVTAPEDGEVLVVAVVPRQRVAAGELLLQLR